MKTIRFAIIGCGRIASRHLEAIAQISNAELAAVCDLKADRAQKYAHQFNVPWHKDYHEMLSKEDIDVVCIITPSGLHATHALDILQYKKHVVIEKPMALRLEEIDQLIAAYAAIGKQIFTIHQNRYNKAVQKIKGAIDQGLFGKLIIGTVRLRWCRPQRYYDQDDWRGTWALDGGALTNQAVHHIDLLRWLLGEVEWVHCTTATRLVNVEIEDTAVATLRFANGALGTIEATTAARPDDFEASISILGEYGTVVAEGASVNRLVTWSFSNNKLTQEEIAEYQETPPNVYGFGHNTLLKEVVDCVAHDSPNPLSGNEGRKAVEVLHALYASAETGAKVYLKDKPMSKKLGVR